MNAPDYDVVIIGAGPAGCGAARLLAAWKHRVLLVDRAGESRLSLAESIPPSAHKVLAAIGALSAVEDAGFLPWRGNTVWWAHEPPRVELFAGAPGYQVERSRFDALLRTLAREAGAEVRTGLVRDVRLLDGRAVIPIEAAGTITEVAASFVLDASGRAGVIARRGFRSADNSTHTVALSGVWQASHGFRDVDSTHTLVASYDDGWAWSVPTARDTRHVTVMVDPARTLLVRGAPALEVYQAELRKVRAFAGVIDEAQLTDGPSGADASHYGAHTYAGDRFLLVGDAASFIDPLSSFGVKKALASAWLAAIVTHTILAAPTMGDEARTFFNEREREFVARTNRPAAQFAAEAAARTPHPFWTARAVTADEDDFDDAASPAALAQDADVLAAFADLRRRPHIRLREGPELRVAQRAAVRGREIVMDDHVYLPAWPRGQRYLRNIDLLALIRLAPHHTDVGELLGAFEREHQTVPLPDFLGALAVLIARGALKHED